MVREHPRRRGGFVGLLAVAGKSKGQEIRATWPFVGAEKGV